MSPIIPPIPPHPVRTIEVLAFPAVQLLDLAGVTQVFAAVNEIAERSGSAPPYLIRVVAPSSSDIRATSGLVFRTEPLPFDGPPDTLIVLGGQGVLSATNDPALVAWLRERAAAVRRVASVCTGAFLLAEAGILDGRRAVTHWEYCERLAKRYPSIAVCPDPIFVQDGNVWTSAGVTAAIDLCLTLVADDLGRPAALAVARNLVVFLKRPGGQAQYSAALSFQTSDDRFAELHVWIVGHLDDDLTLRRLAKQVGMSERSFLRHYREATGYTPQRAVERLRVEAARQLVAETDLPLKRIATRSGFGSEETMRRSFLRQQGVGPQAFRERFGRLPRSGRNLER